MHTDEKRQTTHRGFTLAAMPSEAGWTARTHHPDYGKGQWRQVVRPGRVYYFESEEGALRAAREAVDRDLGPAT